MVFSQVVGKYCANWSINALDKTTLTVKLVLTASLSKPYLYQYQLEIPNHFQENGAIEISSVYEFWSVLCSSLEFYLRSLALSILLPRRSSLKFLPSRVRTEAQAEGYYKLTARVIQGTL